MPANPKKDDDKKEVKPEVKSDNPDITPSSGGATNSQDDNLEIEAIGQGVKKTGRNTFVIDKKLEDDSDLELNNEQQQQAAVDLQKLMRGGWVDDNKKKKEPAKNINDAMKQGWVDDNEFAPLVPDENLDKNPLDVTKPIGENGGGGDKKDTATSPQDNTDTPPSNNDTTPPTADPAQQTRIAAQDEKRKQQQLKTQKKDDEETKKIQQETEALKNIPIIGIALRVIGIIALITGAQVATSLLILFLLNALFNAMLPIIGLFVAPIFAAGFFPLILAMFGKKLEKYIEAAKPIGKSSSTKSSK